MRTCPQCTSTRVRYSHARIRFETFQRIIMGYRFYRCQACNWRGKERKKRRRNPFSSKVSLWKVLFLYGLAAVIILFVVFYVVGVGGSTPHPVE